jgi:hypothetical protein
MFDGNLFLQNVEENPYDNTVPHFIRLDSWILAMWKPQNSVRVLVHFTVANSLAIAYEAVLQVVCNCKHYVWMLWECWMELTWKSELCLVCFCIYVTGFFLGISLFSHWMTRLLYVCAAVHCLCFLSHILYCDMLVVLKYVLFYLFIVAADSSHWNMFSTWSVIPFNMQLLSQINLLHL